MIETNKNIGGFMTNTHGITGKTTLKELSKVGNKARNEKLSPERRKEIATLASHSRKCMVGTPKATHTGELQIGDIKISCAVLDNGKRVVTLKAFNSALGRTGKTGSIISSEGAVMLPNFVSSGIIQSYLTDEVKILAIPLVFIPKQGGRVAYGFEASLLPKVCALYLNARSDGVLPANQKHIAERCEILVTALAQVGITALIDESTGWQKQRENDELQKLFSKFIAQELQPWVKRFPAEFFNHLKRFYGLEEMKKTPLFFGTLINKWIYKELSPEIHEELKRLNPVMESGHRQHRHHQLLTQEIGCPALTKQIQKVTTLLSVSDSKEDFEKLLEKSR